MLSTLLAKSFLMFEDLLPTKYFSAETQDTDKYSCTSTTLDKRF